MDFSGRKHSPKTSFNRRITLLFASVTHVSSDLFYALMIPLLPLMSRDPNLSLSYTEVGLLKTVFGTSSALLQIPFGVLASHVGEFWLLISGNIWVGIGFISMASLTNFRLLFAVTLLAGLGGGTQHPLATSMVSRAYDQSGRSKAIGTVNFAGDLGKILAPVFALAVAVDFGWRATMRLTGFIGIVVMLFSMFLRSAVTFNQASLGNVDKTPNASRYTYSNNKALFHLSVIGFLDAATRTAALTFIPFILLDKSAETREMFVFLIVLLAGGATGKYICGSLNDRYGFTNLVWCTKGATALLLVTAFFTPLIAMAPVLFILGLGLNGTSSSLYSSVAVFSTSDRRSRTYGYYYTVTESAGIAPFIYGWLADLAGLRLTIYVMSLATLLILPISLLMRQPLKSADQNMFA